MATPEIAGPSELDAMTNEKCQADHDPRARQFDHVRDWQGQTGTRDPGARLYAPSSRRMLFSAAGGLGMAACGLLLPSWLEEAAAKEGALHGTKGGRRGKDRRGRHKPRSHGDKKDKNPGQDKPRGFGLSGIAFTIVVNDTHGKSLDLQYYSASDPFGNYAIMGGDSITTNGKQTGFKTVSTSAFVWINNRYYIEARNPLVAMLEGKLGHGGRIDRSGWHDGTVDSSGPLENRFAWTLKMEADDLTFYLSHLDTDASFQYVKLTIE